MSKSDAEVQILFNDTAIMSYNGVLDDNVFGDDGEWYTLLYRPHIKRQPEPYAGPFATYDEAFECMTDFDLCLRDVTPVGYIYTK